MTASLPAGLGVEVAVDGPMLERFVVSAAPVVAIQGPWGSGKSTAACLKLLLNAINQRPHPGTGKRSRVTYVVRNTFDELERTTLATWAKVFPFDAWGEPKGQKPKKLEVRKPLGDGTTLEWDVWFVALDREEDARKLLSAELSDVWFNEAREIPFKLFSDAKGRTDRWPDAKGGCTRPQAIADTNAAPEDHWISVMSGQTPIPEGLDEEARRLLSRPDDWELLVQPPAMLELRDEAGTVTGYRMNPARENTRFVGDRYYEGLLAAATRAQIAERVLNRPGLYRAGLPVFPQFRAEVHVAAVPLDAIPGHPIMVGIDFGRTPAAVLGQNVFGRWLVLRELVAENMGAAEFGRTLKRLLAQAYPEHDVGLWGDPAGQNLDQSDDQSPFRVMWAQQLRVLPAPSNDPVIRIGAVEELLRGMTDGKPRLLVSPACRTLRAALEGGYEYPRRRITGAGTIHAETPLKNRYSHVADALQYLVLGGGEGGALLGRVRAGGRQPGGSGGSRVRNYQPGLAWQGRT